MARLLLGAGASAALHKACDLASKLAQAGHEVDAVLTPRAAQLVSPQLFEALTGRPAWVDELGDARRHAMDHIELARRAELVLVAPATAALLARLALGLADDLLTTACLAVPTRVPRLVCPAMNPAMWAQPAVRRHVDTLREDGWRVLEPEAGLLACGDQGPGRLPAAEVVLEAVRAAFEAGS